MKRNYIIDALVKVSQLQCKEFNKLQEDSVSYPYVKGKVEGLKMALDAINSIIGTMNDDEEAQNKVEEMKEYICDLCRFPYITSNQEELDGCCKRCRINCLKKMEE